MTTKPNDTAKALVPTGIALAVLLLVALVLGAWAGGACW